MAEVLGRVDGYCGGTQRHACTSRPRNSASCSPPPSSAASCRWPPAWRWRRRWARANRAASSRVLRRRRRLRRHLPRVAESRRAVAAAAAVRLREQPVAGLRAPPRDHARRGDRQPGRAATALPAQTRRRQRRRGRARRRRAGGRRRSAPTGKPLFSELVTYRLRGHFEPDDQAYVDAGGTRSAGRRATRSRAMGARLLDKGSLDAGELGRACEQRVPRAHRRRAVAFAQASAWPARRPR